MNNKDNIDKQNQIDRLFAKICSLEAEIRGIKNTNDWGKKDYIHSQILRHKVLITRIRRQKIQPRKGLLNSSVNRSRKKETITKIERWADRGGSIVVSAPTTDAKNEKAKERFKTIAKYTSGPKKRKDIAPFHKDNAQEYDSSQGIHAE